MVATLLSFLFGASGLLNYHRLQEYERRVATGIAALEERHADLERLARLLRTEPEMLRLLARDSGYYRADELVIRVGPQTPAAVPFSPYAPDFSDVGPLVQPQLPVPRDPFNVLALGLFLGLGLFTGLTVKRVLRSRAEQADGAGHADDAAGPDTVAGSVEDAIPAAGWSDAEPAAGDVSTDAAPDGVAAAPRRPAPTGRCGRPPPPRLSRRMWPQAATPAPTARRARRPPRATPESSRGHAASGAAGASVAARSRYTGCSDGGEVKAK